MPGDEGAIARVVVGIHRAARTADEVGRGVDDHARGEVEARVLYPLGIVACVVDGERQVNGRAGQILIGITREGRPGDALVGPGRLLGLYRDSVDQHRAGLAEVAYLKLVGPRLVRRKRLAEGGRTHRELRRGQRDVLNIGDAVLGHHHHMQVHSRREGREEVDHLGA